MIILEPFIWRENHYSYHLTNIEAMEGICKNGLIPLVGDRSKSVGDNIKGVFFFDSLYLMNDWIERLYENKDIYQLELLRFNLKGRKWNVRHCYEYDEFYLFNKVVQDKIEYLRLYDKSGTFLPLNAPYYQHDEEIRILWNSLCDYKPLVKNKNMMEGEQLTFNL